LFLGKAVLSSDCAAAISETINWAHDGGLGVRPVNLQTTNLGVRARISSGARGARAICTTWASIFGAAPGPPWSTRSRASPLTQCGAPRTESPRPGALDPASSSGGTMPTLLRVRCAARLRRSPESSTALLAHSKMPAPGSLLYVLSEPPPSSFRRVGRADRIDRRGTKPTRGKEWRLSP
jgi:hypothetical protein